VRKGSDARVHHEVPKTLCLDLFVHTRISLKFPMTVDETAVTDHIPHSSSRNFASLISSSKC
jgi:hypothetical protein